MNARFATKCLLATVAFAMCLLVAAAAQAGMLFADSAEDFPAPGSPPPRQGTNYWQYGYVPNFNELTYNGSQFVPFAEGQWTGSLWSQLGMVIRKDAMQPDYDSGTEYAVVRRWTATPVGTTQSVNIHQVYYNNGSVDGVMAWVFQNGAMKGGALVWNNSVIQDLSLLAAPTDVFDFVIDTGLGFDPNRDTGDLTLFLVQIAPIPEPGSLVLLGLGGGVLGMVSLRRRKG